VKIKKQDGAENYIRTVTLVDGSEIHSIVSVDARYYVKQDPFPWEKELHDLLENELITIGKGLAELALGIKGLECFIENKGGGIWSGIQFIESKGAPELASVPWELVYIDEEFVALNPKTPVYRCLEGYTETENDIHLNKPISVLLLYAAPSSLSSLMVEEEQLRFALTIGHYIAKGELHVHEIVNCTREKLVTALQYNKYDIIYFTGHGTYIDGMGYMCLENEQNRQGYSKLSSVDFASLIPEDKMPELVFMNCCQSASSSTSNNQLRTFRDIGREVIQNGVPDVIGTISSVFDSDSQIFMRRFFDSLIYKYDVKEAVSKARQALKEKEINTFYHFIHLSQTGLLPRITYAEHEVVERSKLHYFASINHPSLDMTFLGRHQHISQIERAYVNGAKAVVVKGIGGIGKTSLTQMIEKRLPIHYDPRLRVENTIWIDLRGEISLGGLIRQISNIFVNKGDRVASNILREMKEIEVVYVCNLLTEAFGNSVLLTLDNCETLIGDDKAPKDQELYNFIIGLVAHTIGWKVLLTSRVPLDMTLEGRMLFTTHEVGLGSFTYTERVALFKKLTMDKGEDIRIRDNEMVNVITKVAGNPYELVLFVRSITPLSDINSLIEEVQQKTGEYAYLEYHLNNLEENTLETLRLLSVFITPPSMSEIVAIAERLDEFDSINVKEELEKLIHRGFVEHRDNNYVVPSVVSYYLTGR